MKNEEVDNRLWGLASYAAWYIQNIKHHGSCANNFYRPIAKYIEEIEAENDRLKAQLELYEEVKNDENA